MHYWIKYRFNSYICCFTESIEYGLKSNKEVGIELNGDSLKVVWPGIAFDTIGNRRAPLMTVLGMVYGFDSLVDMLTQSIQNFSSLKTTLPDMDHLEITLASAFDLYKHSDFNWEMERRLLLYCEQPDLRNLPHSLWQNGKLRDRLSWNRKHKIPQLKIYDHSVNSGLITKIICFDKNNISYFQKKYKNLPVELYKE